MKINQFCLLLTAGFLLLIPQLQLSAQKDFQKHVNPFIGTGGHGHTFPGPCTPFGAVQLSPDTRLEGWDGCSGYHYTDNVVYGFSHTHLSGTGVSDYGDILFMPTINNISLNNGADGNMGYRSFFKKENESAGAGWYKTLLDDYNTKVTLTASDHCGFHKYEFPSSGEAAIILDLLHRDKVLDSQIRIVSETEIEGYRISDAWAKEQHVFFVAEFSRPIIESGLSNGNQVEKGIEEVHGTNCKGYFKFANADEEALLLKVGISGVDIEGARKNLRKEIPDWDFDETLEACQNKWNQELSKIQVRGGTEREKTIFYTALYHTMIAPNLFMDVDGRYRGTDLKIHQATDHTNYTIFSLWDTFRATHPLYTIIDEQRTTDFIRTFLHQYQQGGQLPVWELAANYTGCMIGYHSVSVITDAYMKGIRNFNAELALEAMQHSAELDHLGLESYKELGYIPSDKEAESVSKTLEYAYDDWCISELAREMGKRDIHRPYAMRAQSYKNLFDPETKFFRAKLNNRFVEPFAPEEVNFHFTEANAWQYSLFVPHDLNGLITLFEGKKNLADRLDLLFNTDSKTSGRHQVDITGLIGQYAHGNEPSHHMAFLYNYLEQPWKAQAMSRRIMKELYSDQPDGLSGNEDCGQMSAWYVMAALGLYQVNPGSPVYTISTPIFEEAKILLENGKTFTIKASNAGEGNDYIQSAALHDKNYNRSFLHHQDILAGGSLELVLSSDPNKQWGTGSGNYPESSVPLPRETQIPYVKSGDHTFFDRTEVAIGATQKRAKIYYTLDGSEPSPDSPEYQAPFELNSKTTLKAMAAIPGLPQSKTITAEFRKIPKNRKIQILSEYANQYAAGGDKALIDFSRGAADFRTGAWQGYHEVDCEVIIDLGKIEQFSRICTGALQDNNSWIFMPTAIHYAISDDGQNFQPIGKAENQVAHTQEGSILQDFEVKGTFEAQYVKVQAKNIGLCPEWHKGAGGQAWIFLDEVEID